VVVTVDDDVDEEPNNLPNPLDADEVEVDVFEDDTDEDVRAVDTEPDDIAKVFVCNRCDCEASPNSVCTCLPLRRVPALISKTWKPSERAQAAIEADLPT
jgi:hypothetical protein